MLRYSRQIWTRLRRVLRLKPLIQDYLALSKHGYYHEAYLVLGDFIRNHHASNPRDSRMGDIYIQYAELAFLIDNDVNVAHRYLNKAKDSGYSDVSRFYMLKGKIEWAAGKYEQAEAYILKCIAIEPTLENRAILGELLLSFDNDRAKSVVTNILVEEPTNCSASISLGLTAIRSGNRCQAISLAEQADKLNPTVGDMYRLGNLYYEIGIIDKALSIFRAVEQLISYSNKIDLYIDISSCALFLGKHKMALRYACQVLLLENNESAKEILLLSTENTNSKYIPHYLRRKYKGTCFETLINAQNARKRNDWVGMNRMISRAAQLNRSCSEAFYLARLCHDAKNWTQALQFYLESDKLNYHDKRMLYSSMSGCYYYLDDLDSAIKYSIRALILNSGDNYAMDILYASRHEAWGTRFGDNY